MMNRTESSWARRAVRAAAWGAWLVVVAALVVALAAWGARTVTADPPRQPGATPPDQPGPERPEPGKPSQSAPPQPGQPLPPVQAQDGPYWHQIYLARSDDGLTWEPVGGMLRDHTSVPEIVRWHDTLWIYAVNAQPHRLIALEQLPDGAWEPHYVEIDGFDVSLAVDPDVVVLPDGRLRLYFYGFSPARTAKTDEGPATIYSAVSRDGLTFVMEPYPRFQSDSLITDPDVVQDRDTWWLYVTGHDGLVIASSTDGLVFQETGSSQNGTISGTVVLDDGTLRQYVCRQGGIGSQVSSDGVTWTPEEGLRLTGPVCDPSVIREPDGSWLMVYKRFVNQPARPPDLPGYDQAAPPSAPQIPLPSLTPSSDEAVG